MKDRRTEGFILGVIAGAFFCQSLLDRSRVEGYIWMVLVLMLGVVIVVKGK